jgi:hypothetical protein
MALDYSIRGDSFGLDSKPRPWSTKQIFSELDLAPDGKRFVIQASPEADSDTQAKGSVHVTFLLNFFQEVQRRLPAEK